MNKNSADAIEQYATGQALFEHEANVITHIAQVNESVTNARGIGNAELPVSQTEDTKTLADLIAEHVPAHQQTEVLALIYDKQNDRKETGEETNLGNDRSNEPG